LFQVFVILCSIVLFIIVELDVVDFVNQDYRLGLIRLIILTRCF